MAWTDVLKPTQQGFVNINPIGKEEYDGIPTLLDQSQTEWFENYWGDTSTEKIAQSFKPTITASVAYINFILFRLDNPTTSIQLQIYTNNSGVPGTLIDTASNTISAGDLLDVNIDSLDGLQPKTFYFLNLPVLTAEVTYWIVASVVGSQSASNYYGFGWTNTSDYSRGNEALYYSGAWHAFIGEDIYFQEYYIDPNLTTITYDSATTYYDSFNPFQWTDINKPVSSTWTNIIKPT